MLSILMIFLAAAPLLVLPTVQSQPAPAASPGSKVTSAGSASGILLSGPSSVTPSFGPLPSVVHQPSKSTPQEQMPFLPKPGLPKAAKSSKVAGPVTIPPVVSCPSSSCDTVSTSAGGATTQPVALNAFDSGTSYNIDIEPADQGLCEGNGYVMEVNNIGEIQLFNSTTLATKGYVTLDNLMGLPSIPTSMGGPWSSGGDPSCLYDQDNGGHWFVTEIVSNSSWANVGPFGGCFAAKVEGCFEGIAVSKTNNPTGSYWVYFLDPNNVNSDPGKENLLNDFAKIGNTRDAFLLFYDEFNLLCPPTCPSGFGQFGFNGAQEFAFNKNAFEQGLSTSSPFFNVAYENMGNNKALYPIPVNKPFQPPPAASCFKGKYAGAVCWYQVIPAQSPGPSSYDNSYGGTGYMVGSLDFLGAGDNRLAVFYWAGLSDLTSSGCSTCSGITFGHQLFTNLEAYRDEGAACPASGGGFCGLGEQEAGTVPLGDHCALFVYGVTNLTCSESGIASNGDGVTQVSYAQHQIWTSVSTLITQQYTVPAPSETPASTPSETHLGAAYWVVNATPFDSSATFTLTGQGYVSAMHEDLEFPAIAAGASGFKAIMTFTLNGPDYFPSTAFGEFTATSNGLSPTTIHIADQGLAPQDGFTEYQGYPSPSDFPATRPRWGDYSWAIYDPTLNEVFFATNYIQSAACSNFVSNPTCGGTRDPTANWGTSVNYITP